MPVKFARRVDVGRVAAVKSRSRLSIGLLIAVRASELAAVNVSMVKT